MRCMKYVSIVLLAAFILGCAGMSQTQQRTVSGGLMGAAAGAGVAAIAGGEAGVGALVGAGAGALGGYMLGESRK
ncbi:hypothetical protein B2D07_07280 [Desulfococcus multivorans]|uniref:Glycine-zipper-containing OmpA-like membrane domain containing protein n=2 Tax=Desulfococcus multivorans TaxID=897 RepID=S7TZJ7_DESML|nr:hypothetical protein B2D07_07280 [Desulfococcus multivorans]EPR42502.1 Glycine-zipper-containing OmpA-like membrane domain containing protein [Desulfococcus multivorans DSM 2059]SJZ97280.1 Glycine-zipper containing OmpA-like membrane domain-containing protein [Desulfococcus multivorans DSM 2059]